MLHTPLAALHGALLSLLPPDSAADAPARLSRLNAALAQCRGVNRLARELLDLARLQAGAVEVAAEPFSLADLVQDVLHKFEPLAQRRGQRLRLHFAPGLPPAPADIAMIERVLSTFIAFALGRGPAHSAVDVHLLAVGDALRVHALLDGGEFAVAHQRMQQALALAQAAADSSRQHSAQAVLAYWSTMNDVDQAERVWGPAMADLQRTSDPHGTMWACDFVGQVHARRGRHRQAIRAFSAVFTHARQSGHVRRAVVACTNMASNYNNLNANDSALEWLEQAMQLARPTGWPASVGMCLMMMGSELDQVHRLAAARQALDEAMAVLQASLPGSRLLMLTRYYMANVVLAQGDAKAAAELATQALAAVRQAKMASIESHCQRALAEALLHQGLRSEARMAADLALQLAEQDDAPNLQILALIVLAEVHAPPALPEGTLEAGPRASLPHLLRALELGKHIDDFIPNPAVPAAAAREYAYQGDHAQAYALAQEANAARDQGQARAAAQRAIAMEVRSELARARAQADALREQAAAEARRAALLQDANATLQRLGSLGREITAQFDLDRVFEHLYRQLQGLLDLQHLSIWLRAEDGGDLQLRFGLRRA